MKIPPNYQISSEILEHISKIDSYRLFFKDKKIPDELKNNIQRISLLKSSVFSARIEGNTLTVENVEVAKDKQKKLEIYNILNAVQNLNRIIKPDHIIDLKIIQNTHALVMKNLSPDKGKFRMEITAIFNQAGVAIYTTPPPEKVSSLLSQLNIYINSNEEKFPLITALISHLVFEKIHPFLDGNGRVGRLLIFAILKSKNYDFGFFVPFEEYLDNHKSDYYYYLDTGLQNTNNYLVFMLKSFLSQVEDLKKRIEDMENKKVILPPRLDEIFNIIKDHPMITFDFIRRRFLKVPERTLRYDLKKLADKNLILKVGNTRGSYYKEASTF
ncbi:hypothetical protein A2954_07720 [Candidatus Roizmanbacteria bacterium RIFCSPLOWO2_01_FULL_37_12]|uniref:Fido domain-containing protein n=1 Tax=Candidatus Roizmanbacteria bacterium RIFCSPLOWO2_01_FULL_37_12 TaxID=1802056 RepID=A0A1F7I844_9BACT|nr:MAG: hypothetical protein A2954_07720 [Candidatus Roizmanbacteria bacterium RIFCSPLOWO2_01_FULL_37_12]